jgi:hypothetical protein
VPELYGAGAFQDDVSKLVTEYLPPSSDRSEVRLCCRSMVPEPRVLEALAVTYCRRAGHPFCPQRSPEAPSPAFDISPDYQRRLRVHRLESDLKFAAFAMVVVPAGGQIGEMTKGLMQ